MRPVWLRPAVILWVFLTTLAPPGLPSCWMEREPCEFHTHFNPRQAHTPHSHRYLIDLAQGTAAQPYPFLSAVALAWLALLAVSGVQAWRKVPLPFFTGHRWLAVPEPPPPKRFLPTSAAWALGPIG